jgi:hypothetical protein
VPGYPPPVGLGGAKAQQFALSRREAEAVERLTRHGCLAALPPCHWLILIVKTLAAARNPQQDRWLAPACRKVKISGLRLSVAPRSVCCVQISVVRDNAAQSEIAPVPSKRASGADDPRIEALKPRCEHPHPRRHCCAHEVLGFANSAKGRLASLQLGNLFTVSLVDQCKCSSTRAQMLMIAESPADSARFDQRLFSVPSALSTGTAFACVC